MEKPTSNQFHDLAVGIAIQSIETRIHPDTTTWYKDVEDVLWTYLSARGIAEAKYDDVNKRVQASLAENLGRTSAQ